MTNINYFDSIAVKWDTMRQEFFREDLRTKAFELAQIQPGRTAADIGAGTGFITMGLIERGLKVIAVDHSKAMLDVLKNKLPFSTQLDCRIGEAENLPLKDNQVDYVFANMFLHHVTEPAAAIKEMARILKPGGILVITDMDKHTSMPIKREHHDLWMGFDRKDVHRWFEEGGMQKVQVQCLDEECCVKTRSSREDVQVSIFIASGKKSDANIESTNK